MCRVSWECVGDLKGKCETWTSHEVMKTWTEGADEKSIGYLMGRKERI